MPGLEDEFGDIIAKARHGVGWSAARLAHASSIDQRDVDTIESYRLTPDGDTVLRIAAALHLDPRKLWDIAAEQWGPGPMAPPPGVVIEPVDVPYGAYTENCYVFGCVSTGSGAIVDPGGALASIKDALRRHNLDPKIVLITHGHGDHTAGLHDILSTFPDLTVVSHEAELPGCDGRWQVAVDGGAIRLGELVVTALHTPGHTAGSTCYAANSLGRASGPLCFVGDTLFAGSIGRPRSTEAYEAMLRAIREKVLSLPSETILLPGHGPATTVREELDHNPFF